MYATTQPPQSRQRGGKQSTQAHRWPVTAEMQPKGGELGETSEHSYGGRADQNRNRWLEWQSPEAGPGQDEDHTEASFSPDVLL